MIPVVWFSLVDGEHPGQKWDAGLLWGLFDGTVWDPVGRRAFIHSDTFGGLTSGLIYEAGGAVVVLPSGVHRERYDEINEAIASLGWVLLVLTADEGSLFETKHIHHPNMRMWVMTPRPGRVYPAGTRFIGEGYEAATPTTLPDAFDLPARDVWFAGQVTHLRRRQMATALTGIAELVETDGFAQGLPRNAYLAALADTKVAPCPSGPVTPDSFRLYEALEAGCLPIADDVCPDYATPGYWDLVAPDHPFPTITDWADAPDVVGTALNDWPRNANQAGAWWQAHKRTMAYWLVEDLDALGVAAEPRTWRDRVTAIVCTSPVKSHPSTDMIETTIASIRSNFPDVEIIVTFDGIRAEQEPYRERYEEYVRRVLHLCRRRWSNVLPMIAGRHLHQSGMARMALGEVRTPLVFYVEHDLPVTGDIPFEAFAAAIEDGSADHIRLTVNTDLEPSHMHLMLDDGRPQILHGAPLTRTVQWSQQPHLASTVYYRDLLASQFAEDEATYIEWRMHSVCAGEWHHHGPMAWFRNRLWIYTPEGNMQRVVHLDGRDGDPVFDT